MATGRKPVGFFNKIEIVMEIHFVLQSEFCQPNLSLQQGAGGSFVLRVAAAVIDRRYRFC
jgi:hypothetical protein